MNLNASISFPIVSVACQPHSYRLLHLLATPRMYHLTGLQIHAPKPSSIICIIAYFAVEFEKNVSFQRESWLDLGHNFLNRQAIAFYRFARTIPGILEIVSPHFPHYKTINRDHTRFITYFPIFSFADEIVITKDFIGKETTICTQWVSIKDKINL